MAQIGAAANSNDKIAQDANDAQRSAIAADLEKKKGDLDDLRKRARAEKAASDREADEAPLPTGPKKPSFDALNAAASSVGIGTFSGFSQASLNLGSRPSKDAQRTADTTESILSVLQDIATNGVGDPTVQ